MNPLCLFLVQLLHFLVVEAVSYDRCRVYSVREKGFESFSSNLGKLQILTQHREFDEENNPYVVRSYLVPEDSEFAFRRILDFARVDYNILVDDLGKEIQEERRHLVESHKKTFGIENVTRTYYSYEKMSDFLEEISKIENPVSRKPIALIETIGKSHEGREMHLVKISSNHAAKKPIMFFEAGIHAREWTAPATALYMIYQLVRNFTYNARALKDIDYYIIPLSNPDGYEFSRSKDRMWRKTRSFYRGRYGVDGNRNFDFHWGESGSSSEPDSDMFRGPAPFSEVETRNIRDAGIKYKDRIIAFVSIHAYGSYILYPWGYKAIKAPQSDILEKISREAVKAIRRYNGTNYKQGTSSILLYEASGGADDYFKGVLGVNLSFTVEITSKRNSFVVPSREIPNFAGEAFEGFKEIAQGALKYYRGEFRKY